MKSSLRAFACVERDGDAYADYSSRFGQYNQDGSGWTVQTFGLVMRDDDRVIAGGRGYVYLGALEIRGL